MWRGTQDPKGCKLKCHPLERLGEASSLQLLRKHHEYDEEQLRRLGLLVMEKQLLDACDGLPLALVAMGAALAPRSDEKPARTQGRWEVSAQLYVHCSAATYKGKP